MRRSIPTPPSYDGLGATFGALLLGGRCPCGRSGPAPCACCDAAARAPAPGPTPLGLDLLLVARAYEGTTRELVARVKYRNERAAIDWLVAPLVRAVHERFGPQSDLLVTWAPTTDARRRGRGFDHAQLLAAAIARPLGLPVRATLRRLDAAPQTGRDLAARRVGPRVVARRVPHRTVLLVDDVVTTGSTLTAAARALRIAGVPAVVGACVARADRAGGGAPRHRAQGPVLVPNPQGESV